MAMKDDQKVRKIIARKVKDVDIPFSLLDHEDGVFTDDERALLLANLRSVFAYAGCAIPDNITIEDGTTIELRELVWKLLDHGYPDEEVVAYARALATLLDTQVKRNTRLIETYDLTDDEADALYYEACGIMRAIINLKGFGMEVREDDVQEAMRQSKMKDARRLLDLIRRLN